MLPSDYIFNRGKTLKRKTNQEILEHEIQDGEEILYLWEGARKKRFIPHMTEKRRSQFILAFFLGYGILVGWILFEAENDLRRSLLSLMVTIVIFQIISRTFSIGPFKKVPILLSDLELSVITNRRILIFDHTERITNIPLSDFNSISMDTLKGRSVIRLSGWDENIFCSDSESLSLLEKLKPLIG